MRVLVTGDRGRLGPAVKRRLEADGHTIRGFDLADGGDIMDAAAVARAAEGVDVVIHLAALTGDRNFPAAQTLSVNLAGTANVLVAAETQGVGRLVFVSSGRALGMLEREADYLPVDDDHRGLPSHPYALAKWLAEEMCEAFSNRTPIETVCLRPVQVFDSADYARAVNAPPAAPIPGRAWHLGVHIDLRDVADAVAAAATRPVPKHSRMLLSAPDITGPTPTLEQVHARAPHIPWRGGPEYAREPFRALVDMRRAREILGWTPRHAWPTRRRD